MLMLLHCQWAVHAGVPICAAGQNPCPSSAQFLMSIHLHVHWPMGQPPARQHYVWQAAGLHPARVLPGQLQPPCRAAGGAMHGSGCGWLVHPDLSCLQHMPACVLALLLVALGPACAYAPRIHPHVCHQRCPQHACLLPVCCRNHVCLPSQHPLHHVQRHMLLQLALDPAAQTQTPAVCCCPGHAGWCLHAPGRCSCCCSHAPAAHVTHAQGAAVMAAAGNQKMCLLPIAAAPAAALRRHWRVGCQPAAVAEAEVTDGRC